MLLANVATKTFMERWKGMAVATAGMGLMLWFAMAAYQGIDTDFFTRMPEAWRALMNIPADGNFTILAYAAMYSSWGALIIGSLTLSMGSASMRTRAPRSRHSWTTPRRAMRAGRRSRPCTSHRDRPRWSAGPWISARAPTASRMTSSAPSVPDRH